MLEQIRLGKTNSEIAHELAISVAGVKYHVGNMLSKLGVADRAGLAAWSEQGLSESREQRGARFAFPMLGWWKFAAAGGVLAAGAVAVVELSPLGGDNARGAPEQVTFDVPAGYAQMTADDLKALGMVHAGLILRDEDGSEVVLAVQIRESLSALFLGSAAEVVEGPGAEFDLNFEAVAPNAVNLKGEAGGQQIRVTLWAEGLGFADGTRIAIEPDLTRRISFHGEPPGQLLLAVTDASNRAPLRAAISTDGHLFVDPRPLPPSMVLDNWTGTALDVAGSPEGRPLGPVGPGLFRFTGCDVDAGICSVSFRSVEPLTAPYGGELRCLDRENAEIDAGEFILHIERVNTGYGGSADFACEPHVIAAGDIVGDAGKHWSLRAFTASGRQISAGVSFDGRFFVGEFAPTVGCPCVTGN